MADKSELYRFAFSLSDFSRDYFDDFDLRLALHPSESISRMLRRLLVFCFCANKCAQSGRGLCVSEAPEWKMVQAQNTLSVLLGRPSHKRIRQVAKNTDKVLVYHCDYDETARWFASLPKTLASASWLTVYWVDTSDLTSFQKHLKKRTSFDCMIQDDVCLWYTQSQQFSFKRLALSSNKKA